MLIININEYKYTKNIVKINCSESNYINNFDIYLLIN